MQNGRQRSSRRSRVVTIAIADRDRRRMELQMRVALRR
jgi:hypothetical protein